MGDYLFPPHCPLSSWGAPNSGTPEVAPGCGVNAVAAEGRGRLRSRDGTSQILPPSSLISELRTEFSPCPLLSHGGHSWGLFDREGHAAPWAPLQQRLAPRRNVPQTLAPWGGGF